MSTQQEIIDKLIDYIDKAILKNSVSNRHVAEVLSFLNEGLKKCANIDDIKALFLSKIHPDSTKYLLKFLVGAEFGNYSEHDGTGAFINELGDAIFNSLTTRSDLTIGGKLVATIIEALDKIITKDLTFSDSIRSKDFISGLTGTGIHIGANGEIEAQSMKLHKELIVPTLIYNRVRVVGNELWVTEGGDIESIEPDANSGDNLYWLKLKGTDANSPCPFWEDDIIRGIVKTKGDNGEFGGFYTVEMRVVAIAANQSFSVIPRFADKAPAVGLTIARIGNFTNQTRMRSIYLSSDGGYIRFLDEVDGWDIEPRMIKCQLGNTDGVQVEGMENIAGYNAYFDYAIARGAFVQISQDGVTERPVACFKGEWKVGKYYYYDEVTRNGSRYLCIAKTTEQQPAYDSTDWLMTEGNAKFTISVTSSKGYEFFSGQLDTTLSATVFSGNEDITGSISLSQVRWYRKSGDNVSDTIWNTNHASAGVSIALTSSDIPSIQPELIEFKCEVTINYNEKVYKPSDSIFV